MPEPRKKRTYTITPEERARRSAAAKARHEIVVDPDTGRRDFGGPQRESPEKKRNKRIQAFIAELAQDPKIRADMERVLRDGLKAKHSIKDRLKTLELYRDSEQAEIFMRQKDRERDLSGKTREELEAEAYRLLAAAHSEGRDIVGEIVEGTAEDIG